MPPLEKQLQPASSGYPAMELYEMEGYVLQSLELLATTPINQYCGPENAYSELEPWPRSANRSPQSDAVPSCKLNQIHSYFEVSPSTLYPVGLSSKFVSYNSRDLVEVQ